MSEHNYTYHDDSFSLDKTESYTLLIQVEANTFSYAISNNGHLIAWAENHPLDELSDPQELLDLLSARYHHVIIGLPAQNFTLVPTDLATAERLPNIARFLDVKADNRVLAQVLDEENIIVYKTPATAVNAAEDFGLRNTVFTSKGWLTAIAQNNPGNNNLYLNVENNKVEICHFALGKLRFYNAFDFTGDDELVYFAVLVAGELNLDARYTSLYISGDIDENDSKLTRLAEFFRKAEVNTLQVLQLPKEIVPHRVLSIAALSLCASSEVA
ncbi:DUF3822 family protein [Mucilaginibacter celer]|uniref:DUF3822 family protein n=1 Tax=Mucilaginibacter celer TaxID=2305508 RepID=A0A494VUA4_9SPHI|nr:DUF3822 family protein [Mucilaginibacter celer]AYL94983.1 DUF3822 family protein [Mucilaginibacter celer]